MGKFKLINPVIIGTFNDTYNTQSADEAAKKFWESLTDKYISGSTPRFYFSLMDMSDKGLHHFSVKEKMEGGNANYSISKIEVNLPKDMKTNFLKEVQKVKTNIQQGGGSDDDSDDSDRDKKKRRRRHDDDSSSSSSDSDDVDAVFRRIRRKMNKKPIVHWWYAPSVYGIDTIFTPSFIAPISPNMQLWMPF